MAESSSRPATPRPTQVARSRSRVAVAGNVTVSSASGRISPSRGSVLVSVRTSLMASGPLGLDDFGHGHAQPVIDADDLAACHQPVVDIDIDRLADLAVKLNDGAAAELQQL